MRSGMTLDVALSFALLQFGVRGRERHFKALLFSFLVSICGSEWILVSS